MSITDKGHHEPDASGYLSHRQIVVVMSGVITGLFLAGLDQSIVATALPRITSDLGGLDKLSWVVTAYLLSSTASTPLWGKISDLYGRRLVFQVAIGVFVAGSLLCGAAQDMTQLVAFRAAQGLGGGGLMALAFATIGDVVPPRERPRYAGYIAVAFGGSSVLGPVLGGFFADGPGWRWIFYVNLPVGLAAFVVTSYALRIRHTRRDHSIDYLGAAVIVAAVSTLLLYTSWAGPDHGWGSTLGLALLICGVGLTAFFVLVERRAAEPIIPMRLFRNPVYTVGNAFGFLMGAAMFGVMVFLPVYLQVVKGMSPTASGLGTVPMVVGLFTTSIPSGRLMARSGRYKKYPPAGAALLLVGVLLLSRLGAEAPYWQVAVCIFVVGMGLGLTMQVITVAVQNALDRNEIGVASSSVQFFRQMGGSFGAAAFGAILTSRLAVHLRDASTAPGVPDARELAGAAEDVQAIRALPDAAEAVVTGAFADAMGEVFLAAVPIAVLALVVSLFLREIPLAAREPQDRPTPLPEPT